MTREQAINYLISSGFSDEQVSEVVRALTYEPTTKNDLGVDCISRAQTQTEIEMNASRYTIAKERGGMGQVEWSDQLIKVSDAVDIIRHLPSVTPQDEPFKPMVEMDLYSVIKQKYIERDVLDKIRAEVETKYGQCILCEIDSGYDRIHAITEMGDIADILQILDKYKAEQE